MGKYLQMLDELYQPEEKNQISTEKEVTKPTKALLSPFVSANSKDIEIFKYQMTSIQFLSLTTN